MNLKGKELQDELRRDRAREARRIVVTMGLIAKVKRMKVREQKFVEQMHELVTTQGDDAPVPPVQVFWLRELKDRFLA